jgi:hypothetical protein
MQLVINKYMILCSLAFFVAYLFCSFHFLYVQVGDTNWKFK